MFSRHYIADVLPTSEDFKAYDASAFINWITDPSQAFAQRYLALLEAKEYNVEDQLIRPVLGALGHRLWGRPSCEAGEIDQVSYIPATKASAVDDGFSSNFENTIAIIESKKRGRIQNKHFITKSSNEDEIYQTLNYMLSVNTQLENTASSHRVEFALLTDGSLWRLYSRKFTHSQREYERHFIEFDLPLILTIPKSDERNYMLKLFAYFMDVTAFDYRLEGIRLESSELAVGVTTELREQVYTALEFIATGLWRQIAKTTPSPYRKIMEADYGINVDMIDFDNDIRARVLRIIYDESLAFLLRILFILYSEDRSLLIHAKVFKGPKGIVEELERQDSPIGAFAGTSTYIKGLGLDLSEFFDWVDDEYNGGLFSREKHPLLQGFHIDSNLFINAIDNLCRVNVGGRNHIIDFSGISIRELGTIYESLLEYKLGIVEVGVDALPSIVNKKRIRHNVQQGDLYLINQAGERKKSGSYYTPDAIVEYLVRETLGNKLEAIKDQYTTVGGTDYQAVLDAVLELTIVDPAMGSGHFLLSAFNYILQFLRQVREAQPGDESAGLDWEEEELEIRSLIARKCIYGVDLNPAAVEIAHMVMWMKVFRPDRPFEFLEYNLVCGNSLLGVYDDDYTGDKIGEQLSWIRSQQELERMTLVELQDLVRQMLVMPRDTKESAEAVRDFWQNTLVPVQKQAEFFYNTRLSKWFLTKDQQRLVESTTEQLTHLINNDPGFVQLLQSDDPILSDEMRKLASIDQEIRERFRPLHWRVAFPHVFVAGGFDVVLGNPPWDLVKSNHNEFFSDYIEGYANMEAVNAKKVSEALMDGNPTIRQAYIDYVKGVEQQNDFYSDAYKYQIAKDKDGITLKGYNNLYKVFVEKAYRILKNSCYCGFVIPDNVNIDNGCTGLRRLLFNEAKVEKLIMFENRRLIFPAVHRQYKFQTLVYTKETSKSDYEFEAGFYWLDPEWLNGQPKFDSEELRAKEQAIHRILQYNTAFIRTLSPDKLVVFETRKEIDLQVLKKLSKQKLIGDENRAWYVYTYQDFNMTSDSNLFNSDGIGWPLAQGITIRHYEYRYDEIERWVVSATGEQRLAAKRKGGESELQNRKYRIAWRDVAQPTDSRSLIPMVIPRFVFTGNTLWMIDVILSELSTSDAVILSGVNAILSSFVPDYYIRLRMAKHVSAFILKETPVPDNIDTLRELGELALPLFAGVEYDELRGDVQAIADPAERSRRMALLDTKVALLYGLSYEEMQHILSTFPLVNNEYKQMVLRTMNELMP